jgi:hypothetical protein
VTTIFMAGSILPGAGAHSAAEQQRPYRQQPLRRRNAASPDIPDPPYGKS